jgi:arylamine N-acetyltransferase
MTLNTSAILAHLRLSQPAPTPAFLNDLLTAWATCIPWESVSRIARHQQPGSPLNYARDPEAFYADALRHGTGGTCFESNFALKALLDALGFTSDLIFCDMLEDTGWQIDPHSAVIVRLDGERYLADAGFPVPAALRLSLAETTTVVTPVYHYEAIPAEPEQWEVRWHSGDNSGLCFLAKGTPIDRTSFWERLVRDHEPDGFFLQEVIIHRQDGNQKWRFSEGKGLLRRTFGTEEPVMLAEAEEADLPGTLSRYFHMNRAIIAAALNHPQD